MMLLHLLLHVLIFHLLTAKGGQKDASKTNVQQAWGMQRNTKNNEKQEFLTPKDKNYVLKHIDKCPEKGHYFVRDYSTNRIESATCYLCFCQSANTAVCWRRDNKRCNDDSLRSSGVGNRGTKTVQNKSNDTRIRRSPGFTDIFFRDASRDMFNKNTEDRQCKPYESSFSDDCPPADWCTGCTVCDCDANGRWDCHILSFCSDPKKSKTSRKMVKKKRVNDLPIGARPRTSMPIMNRRKSRKHRTTAKKVVKKSVTQQRKPKQKQQKPPLRYKRIPQKPKTSKGMFKKRNIATHKRVHLNKKAEVKNETNAIPDDLAKEIVKRMMLVVNKLVQRELHNMTKLVAKRQQWFDLHKKNMYTTTIIPRIIKGSIKKWQKRETEIEQNKERSTLSFWQNRYKRDLTSFEIDTHNAIVSSTDAIQKEKPIDSTALPIQPDSNDNSIDKNTQSITVMPLTTHTENDYYQYILATNIIPLTRNKIKYNELVKPGAVNVINKISTTDQAKIDRTDTVTEEQIRTESENITQEIKNGTEKTTSLHENKTPESPSTTETSKYTVNRLQNTTNATTKGSKLVDDIVLNYVSNPYKYLPEVDPSENDIKAKNWPPVKIVKSKFTTTESLTEGPQKHFSSTTIITKNNLNKVHRKDVKRIAVSRKYNLLKALNFHKCPFFNKFTANENETYMIGQPTKTSDVINDLNKLSHEYNTTRKLHNQIKKFSLLKYLRKIFNNVFKQKNRSDRFSRYHILETLCEHFGPCKIRLRDKNLLRSKLTDLNHETMAILKTVKIIKGLLILLEDSSNSNKTLSKKENLGSSIQRLNSILKGNYGDYSKEPLTVTEMVQIEYIKKNTKAFVKSVGKFATLLNDIIDIITKDADKPMQTNFHKHQMGKDPFKNLKDLLIKYNLVQNNFMKKMYDLVSSFENRNYERSKVSYTRGLNSSIAIENFSRNILNNLRQLKHLAQTLNYSARTKREARDDDAIEYLLMLMEYLFKQNHPLDAAPVNDGIDLLLEAIKNAPDIKTVRKKVLVNTPSGTDTTMMAIPRNLLYRSSTDTPIADPESDSETTSNEDSETPKINTNEDALNKKIEENKDLFDIIDEEKEVVDKLQFDRRAGAIQAVTDITTNVPLYDDEENKTFGNSIDTYETTQSPQLAYEEENIDKNTDRGERNDNVVSENPGNAKNNFYENTENVNVYSNTVNNNYDMNTGYGNNEDVNTPDGNIYMSNIAEGNVHNAVDNSNYNSNFPKDVKNYDKKAYDFSKPVTEETFLGKGVVDERIKPTEDRDKKIETVYTGEIDEEETTHGTGLGSGSETTTVVPQEIENPKNKYVSKELKTLDSYDNEKLDKKSKLEWIEENFRREYSHYDEEKGKAHEEKREDIKAYTPVTVVPRRTSAPEHNSKNKHSIDVSMISNEVSDNSGKKKKSKINTEEVMFKKQMDLLNSLDYVTEKPEFEETESKDTGTADEKYSENFPAYFV